MQVVCGNCQLNFQAPAGATGLVCPICRSPLRPAQGAAEAPAANPAIDWNHGTLDDLIAILGPPAVAARVEVFAAGSDIPAGEVHLLAGGVSDAVAPGVSPNDALDYLKGISPVHFRVEPRLPNPADGDLTYPGPDAGTLDARPLAHLMRYSEQFVITCSIEVWRGNENARVDYRKGEISGVTVGGIDAPERLAEVMRWTSGNYRLVVPRLTLPDSAAKTAAAVAAARAGRGPAAAAAAAAPAPAAAASPAPAPAAAAPAARVPAPAMPATNRTIFGMPAADVAALRAAANATEAAPASASAKAERPSAPAMSAATSAAPSAAPQSVQAAPAPAPAAVKAPPPSERASSTKTIFGVSAPVLSDSPSAPAAAPPKSKKQQRAEAAAAAAAAKNERKTGARKTLVPRPEIIPPAANALDMAAAAADASASASAAGANLDSHATQAGFSSTDDAASSAPALQPSAAPAAVAVRHAHVADDETSRLAPRAPARRETPIWTYVSVGFTFGLVLLGIYHLVGLLAH